MNSLSIVPTSPAAFCLRTPARQHLKKRKAARRLPFAGESKYRSGLSGAFGFSLSLGETLLVKNFKVHFRQMDWRNIGAVHQVGEVGAEVRIDHGRADDIRDMLQGLDRNAVDGEKTRLRAFDEDNHLVGGLDRDGAADGHVVKGFGNRLLADFKLDVDLRLFLLGAIHRAFCPGCKFEVMLCLVGGQGAGKSTFFRLLAVKDEWFSDDLRKLDDDNVYRKLQGHWIIEMSEMIATANAKSIEEIKSFLSRQKEVYKIPYETHPEDRLRQCVFGGTSNALDFLPLDRSGNRRFLPVMVYPEQAEVHVLDDEAASRAYIEQVWAEAMTTYKSGDFKLSFTPEMIQYLKEHQRDFMPEDTKAGMIQAYLDRYTGSAVCSKQLFREALNHPFDEPKQWEIREVNDIMNHGITGWKYFSNPRIFEGYGRQKGWEREAPATGADNGREKTPDGFVEVTEQVELPF